MVRATHQMICMSLYHFGYAMFIIFQAYGYQILQTLITDLDPDQRVKNAMNEINSSKRLKFAIAERAEGDKILQVKNHNRTAYPLYLTLERESPLSPNIVFSHYIVPLFLAFAPSR